MSEPWIQVLAAFIASGLGAVFAVWIAERTWRNLAIKELNRLRKRVAILERDAGYNADPE